VSGNRALLVGRVGVLDDARPARPGVADSGIRHRPRRHGREQRHAGQRRSHAATSSAIRSSRAGARRRQDHDDPIIGLVATLGERALHGVPGPRCSVWSATSIAPAAEARVERGAHGVDLRAED